MCGMVFGCRCYSPQEELALDTWEFPKIGGTLFWGPYNKDPTC